jgi:hypothetical protein
MDTENRWSRYFKPQTGLLAAKVLLAVNLLIIFSVSGCEGCGCAACGAKVTTHVDRQLGRAVIDLQNLTSLASGEGTRVIAVTYSGRLLSGADDEGPGSFSQNRNYEVTRTGVTPAPVYESKNIAPGRWEIRVQAGEWNATCEGQIERAKGTSFSFTVGQSGCRQ